MSAPPATPVKTAAFLIGSALLVGECALTLLDWGPWAVEGKAIHFWMAIAGGPICLAAGLLTAVKGPRHAGGLLWLGGATVALGIALRADNRLAEYFTGLALFVVPQVVSGSLFLISGKKAPGKAPGRNPPAR